MSDLIEGTVTYWLYYGTRVLTAIRMPEGATDHEIIQKALDDQEKCPGAFGAQHETPGAFRTRLHYAKIRRFEDRLGLAGLLEPDLKVYGEPFIAREPTSLKDGLRKLIAMQLWSWAITLKCWAWKVHREQTAELDAELTKETN